MGRFLKFKVGDILKVNFPESFPPGHEQHGTRPSILVGIPDHIGNPRFSLFIVVPTTTQISDLMLESPNLYPILEPSSGGFLLRSAVLIDQIRTVTASHAKKRFGTINVEQKEIIRKSLRLLFSSFFTDN